MKVLPLPPRGFEQRVDQEQKLPLQHERIPDLLPHLVVQPGLLVQLLDQLLQRRIYSLLVTLAVSPTTKQDGADDILHDGPLGAVLDDGQTDPTDPPRVNPGFFEVTNPGDFVNLGV